jgi:hypothetical protein
MKFIIARDIPDDCTDSPMLFNEERYEEYRRTYGEEPDYVGLIVFFSDVIDWLLGMDKDTQNFILRNAEISDDECRCIKAELAALSKLAALS